MVREMRGRESMFGDDAPARTNLNFFFTLDAILNSPSLVQAASRASLSQPAISMALKKARAHYNDEIVSYTGGRRELTALALALRPQIRRILREAQLVLDYSLSFDPAVDERTIRMTMPDFVEVMFLPHVLRAVRVAAPGIRLEIIPFEYRAAPAQFEKGLDLAILPEPLTDASCGQRLLYDDQLSVMISSHHPAASKGSITREEYETGSHAALFDEIDMLAPSRGPVADLLRRRAIVTRTGIYAALPSLILDTDLIVSTSTRYGQHCGATMDLTCVPLPVEPDSVEIFLQWQRHRENEPLMQWLLNLLGDLSNTMRRYQPD